MKQVNVVECGECHALFPFVYGMQCPECGNKDSTKSTLYDEDHRQVVQMRHQTAVRVLRLLLKEVTHLKTAQVMRDMCVLKVLEIGDRSSHDSFL